MNRRRLWALVLQRLEGLGGVRGAQVGCIAGLLFSAALIFGLSMIWR